VLRGRAEKPASRTRSLSVISGDQDDVMDARGSRDEPVKAKEEPSVWTAVQVDEDVLMSSVGAAPLSQRLMHLTACFCVSYVF
jgi:hypothetical protein